MLSFWKKTGILIFIGVLTQAEKLPSVTIPLGTIVGYHKTSKGGRQYVAFEGIPYAKPPIGQLRFEPPQEPNPWNKVLIANKIYNCLQMDLSTRQPRGIEDCLYLNVYVPKSASDLDVLVFIHGGGFMTGSADLAGPGYFMDRDVVYVSINYRLGPFGFLSTEDNVVPGNMGLKDQSMALVWIQKNIKSFGGNPNSVTLMGGSAGGTSIHYHYFSPLSKGLFHKGISQSGSALVQWAIHKSPLKVAKKLGEFVGCNNVSTLNLITCLKKQSAEDIVNHNFYKIKLFPLSPFSPVIESETIGAFLSDYPYKLLEAGNVTDLPWITSAVTEEGSMGLPPLDFEYEFLNKNWNSIIDVILNYDNLIAEIDKRSVAQRIKKFYLNNKDVTEDNVQDYIKLFGDRYIYLAMEKAARLQAKITKSPVYAYIYGYKLKNHKKVLKFLGFNRDYGVAHGTDGFLIHPIKVGDKEFSETLSNTDAKVKEMFLDFITSFAKDGKPVIRGIRWDPVSDSKNFVYLFVGNNMVKTISKCDLSAGRFWESLPIREPGNECLEFSNKDEL